MSIFGKSAFEKQVEALTAETLRETNIHGNLELADAVNKASDDGKEVAKLLIKRTKHKNPHVQLLALQVLGVCMKNCMSAFHQHVGTKDHLKALNEIALEKKTNPHVRDFLLTLIQSWAEAFSRHAEFQMPIYGEYYEKLRAKGAEFPARDMAAMAPVFTPVVGRMSASPNRRASGADVASPYAPPEVNLAYHAQIQEHFGSPNSRVGIYPPQQQAGGHVPGQPAPLHPQMQFNQGQPQYNPGGQMLAPGPMQYPPQQHPQQPPPQQQPVKETPEARWARKRSKLTEKQLKLFRECTSLTNQYSAKTKNETHLVLEYLTLLKDLSAAADSPAALKADPLASNLARLLTEVRNRYTQLILELGDIVAPEHAKPVEFLLDLAIRMIDSIRLILDFHRMRCDGVRCVPPEVVMPRSLAMPEGLSSPEQQPAQNSRQAPQPYHPAGAGSSPAVREVEGEPRQMQLFELPLPSEDDEKVAANIFASHHQPHVPHQPYQPNQPPSGAGRSPQASPGSAHAGDVAPLAYGAFPSVQHQPQHQPQQPAPHQPAHHQPQASAEIRSASQRPHARAFASPTSFASAESFSPQEAFIPVADPIEQRQGEPDSYEPAQPEPEPIQPEQIVFSEPVAASPPRRSAEDELPRGEPERTPFDESYSKSPQAEAPSAFEFIAEAAEEPHHAIAEPEPAPASVSVRAKPIAASSRQAPATPPAAKAVQVEASDPSFESMLGPMRAFQEAGGVIGQSHLRKVSTNAHSTPPHAQAAAAAPSAAAVSPGGPSSGSQPSAAGAAMNVDDAFLDDLMSLAGPKKPETKEGEE